MKPPHLIHRHDKVRFYLSAHQGVDRPIVYCVRRGARGSFWLDNGARGSVEGLLPSELDALDAVIREHREEFLQGWYHYVGTRGLFPLCIARRRRFAMSMALAFYCLPIAMIAWSLISENKLDGMFFPTLMVCLVGSVGTAIGVKWSERGIKRQILVMKCRACPGCAHRLDPKTKRHRCPECGLPYDIEVVHEIWNRWFTKDFALIGVRSKSQNDDGTS